MRSAIAPVQSAGGLAQPAPIAGRAARRRTSRCRRSPARRSRRCCPISVGEMSTWMNCFGAPCRCRPRSCPCRATAASSGARRPASRRRLRPARTSARRRPTARACRAAGPWPSTSAGRGCRSSRRSARISASACAYAAPLPRMISGRLAPLSRSSARCTASGAGIWLRRRVDDLDQRLAAGVGVHRLREQLRRQVEVDAARAARHARSGSRARCRRRCLRHAARGTPPCTAAWRWRAGPSPRSRPAAGRRSRARSSR